MANLDRLGLIGQTVDGRYTLIEQIGEGGMGAVYRAQHKRLGRQVAIKFLHQQFAKNHEALDRFFNEARAAATLGHPNIAESFDVGELADGSPFIVLELLKGRSIHEELVRVGSLSIRRALRIARQIALGLDAAHQQGIIHRDLKSENVFLTDREDNPDHVKILDFGVARILENPINITKPGHLIGTPEVMPPEQIIAPDTIDARVDIYAAGVILYQMLSGQKPYGSLPLPALLHRILEEAPPPLTSLPDDVRKLVEDAMARDRSQRIQTMTELRDRIDACMAGIAGPVTPLGTRLPPDISAAVTLAMAERTSSAQVAAPAPTGSQVRDVGGPSRSLAIRAMAGGGALALAGIMFAVFHSTKASSSAPPPPRPVQAATHPAAAPAAVDPRSTRPAGPREAEASAAVSDPAPAPRGAAAPPELLQGVADVPRPVPVEPRVAISRPHAAPPRVAAAHPGQQGLHAATRLQVAVAPAGTGSRDEVAEPPPAQGSGATRPWATPPDGRAPPVAVTSAGSGSPAEIASAPAPATPVPSVPATPAVKKDEIDVAATRAAVRSHVAAIQQCYERAKRDDQSLAGSMTVRITIAPDGAVIGTQVAKSTIGSSVVERCVTAEISRWRLPRPTGGNAASLLYPFVFE